ncbi:MAG: thiol reductant ABC exporter subunit CydC [Peptococcaceae bacterium]|nr:thiol reductant ABC exporter subunit CydC [Peptococcaceae bacterium]
MEGIRQLTGFIRQYKGQVFLAGILGACTVLCSVGLLGTSAVLISRAAIVPAVLELMTLVALVRFFGIFRAVFRYTERLVSHDVTLKVLANLRSWYYRRLMPLLPGAVGNKGARLFKNILNDVEILQFFYLRVVAAPLVCVLVLVVMSLILWFMVPQAALILLAAFFLEGIVFPLIFGVQQKKHAEAEQAAQDEFYRQTSDFLLGFDSVWFSASGKVDDVKQARKELYKKQRGSRNLDGMLQFCNGLTGVFVLAGSFYAAALQVQAGNLDGVYLVMIPLIAWSSLEAVQPMPLAVRYLFESQLAVDDMLQVVNTPARGREDVCDAPEWKQEGIVFENVSFAYQTAPVLKDISFSIRPGEKVAVLGGIGSGKSTMMNLLLGFYRQNSGSILLDGVSLDDVNVTQLGEHLAVVRQDCALFSGTIRENLRYAADCSDEEMYAALQKAGLLDYVQQLPEGLDYVLQESGSNLSGGQKKRMALAQLFLQDKPFILLDEVLEGLDEQNIGQILPALMEYGKDRTMLYITHDLSVLEWFDRVIEFRDGSIVYDGSQNNWGQEK